MSGSFCFRIREQTVRRKNTFEMLQTLVFMRFRRTKTRCRVRFEIVVLGSGLGSFSSFMSGSFCLGWVARPESSTGVFLLS